MKVFLSSTYIDLIEHRKAAHDALEQLGLHVIWMEAFGARTEDSTTACLKEVEESDLFVGIYAHRYGYIPKDATASITEQEFDHAQKLGKPIFGFIVNEDHDWKIKHVEHDKKDKLNTFLNKVKKQPVEFFTTPDNLASGIASSVGHHLSEINSANSNRQSEIVTPKSPSFSTLPTQPYFFGREKELAVIADAISPESRTWGALIDGPGGIGKTALAVRAAHLAPQGLFERKIFITAKVRELTPEGEKPLMDFSRDNYFSMLNELALELGEEGILRLAPDERANQLRISLAGKKILIVLDNLETLPEDERIRLLQFLSRLPPGNKAIATSRRRRSDVDARAIRLDRLQEDEALYLIAELAKTNKRLEHESDTERRKLYEITNGNPLLIKWVCGQLGREGSAMYTIAQAYSFIENSPKENDPLEYIFGDLLQTFNDSETKILAALTHFTQSAKPRWIVEMTEIATQAVETTLEDLTDRSILIANNESHEFYLPPLAAQFIRNKRPDVVIQTADRLADKMYALILQYGGYDNYEGFKILENEWPTIYCAFPHFLRYPNNRLQSTCDSLAYFLNFSGKWDEWLLLSIQAEAKSLSAGEISDARTRVYQAGWIHYTRQEPLELLNCIHRAEGYLEEAGQREKAFITRLKGLYYRLIKDYEKAIDLLEEALGVWRGINSNSDDVVLALNDLANVEVKAGDYLRAERDYNEAIQISEKINFAEGVANVKGNLANLAITRKQWKKAKKLAHESLKLAEKIGMQEIIANNNFFIAKAYLHLNEPQLGLMHAQKAIQIFTRIRHKDALEETIAIYSECNKMIEKN